MTAVTLTPGQALRDALAALGWHVLPWASMSPAEREGLEGAARATAPAQGSALAALTKVTESHERVMYAAGIDISLGDPGAARRLLGEQLDGYDGPEWDGTETGTQYLERAREGRQP